MIRFTLRQFRTQAAVGFGALAVLAIVAVITEPNLSHVYSQWLLNCTKFNNCSNSGPSFSKGQLFLEQMLRFIALVAPGLIGLFWGAPLVARELEAGTFRLAWTQSVVRSRWVLAKLAVVGVGSMAAGGLLSLITTWWSSSFDAANQNLYEVYDSRGLVPIGYAAFAFVLGVTVGAIVRRTLPSIAATLAIFVAVRVMFALWVRSHLLAPVRAASAITGNTLGFGQQDGGQFMLLPGSSNIPNAWFLNEQFADKAGNAMSTSFASKNCPSLLNFFNSPQGPPGGGRVLIKGPGPDQVQRLIDSCATKVSKTYHVVSTYQPSSHYWPMQWTEFGIYLALALVLAGGAYWWIRHRIA